MPTWLSVILEIIKISVPALVVFFTVNSLLQSFLENQRQIRQMELKQNSQNTAVPLRLQAYERLSLFCERISIPSLLLRLREADMSAKDLRIAMLLAIQQEFEYNITQQVYVSEQLWEIIKLSRDEAVSIVNEIAATLSPEAPAKELSGVLLNFLSGKETAFDKAQIAIKKEAGIILG